ncbi:MAG: hypothetical protein PHG66_05855 [Candidatus Colwellbacteria bacterium]|nr:hypothetical protein [Candidatus Colwellbacteria bacterium]
MSKFIVTISKKDLKKVKDYLYIDVGYTLGELDTPAKIVDAMMDGIANEADIKIKVKEVK